MANAQWGRLPPEYAGEVIDVLANVTIIATAVANSPYVSPCALIYDLPSDYCRNPGIDVEMFFILARMLGFRHRLIPAAEPRIINGANQDGDIVNLVTGKANISIRSRESGADSSFVTYGYPLHYYNLGITVSRAKNILGQGTWFLKPIEPPVQMAIVASIVVLSFTVRVIAFIDKHSPTGCTLGESLWISFGTVLNQNYVIVSPSYLHTSRIVQLLCSIFGFLITVHYSSLLIKFALEELSAPGLRYETHLDILQDTVRGKYTALLPCYEGFSKDRCRDLWKKRSARMVFDEIGVFHSILDHNRFSVVPSNVSAAKEDIAKQLEADSRLYYLSSYSGALEITKVKPDKLRTVFGHPSVRQYYSYAFPKNSTLVPYFSAAIHEATDRRVYETISNKYILNGTLPGQTRKPTMNPLKIEQMRWIFAAVLSGAVMAFMIVGLEKLFYLRCRSRISMANVALNMVTVVSENSRPERESYKLKYDANGHIKSNGQAYSANRVK